METIVFNFVKLLQSSIKAKSLDGYNPIRFQQKKKNKKIGNNKYICSVQVIFNYNNVDVADECSNDAIYTAKKNYINQNQKKKF